MQQGLEFDIFGQATLKRETKREKSEGPWLALLALAYKTNSLSIPILLLKETKLPTDGRTPKALPKNFV